MLWAFMRGGQTRWADTSVCPYRMDGRGERDGQTERADTSVCPYRMDGRGERGGQRYRSASTGWMGRQAGMGRVSLHEKRFRPRKSST